MWKDKRKNIRQEELKTWKRGGPRRRLNDKREYDGVGVRYEGAQDRDYYR